MGSLIKYAIFSITELHCIRNTKTFFYAVERWISGCTTPFRHIQYLFPVRSRPNDEGILSEQQFHVKKSVKRADVIGLQGLFIQKSVHVPKPGPYITYIVIPGSSSYYVLSPQQHERQ